MPVQQVKRKQVGCLCCAAGDVEFVVQLPRTGYCVTNGDIIPLSVNVQNNSTRVIHLNAKIVKQVKFFVYSNENTTTDTVTEISSDPINPGATSIWSPTNFIVPRVPPTLVGCRIINVEYSLKVSAVIPNSFDLSCKIPLVLGNVLPASSSDHSILGAIVTALVERTHCPSAPAVQTRHPNAPSSVHTTSATLHAAADDFDDPYNTCERDALI